ncbi:MAG TPA: glycoside hydrolase family 3 N-terminal domain-containing protein [Terriglobia bacterium]
MSRKTARTLDSVPFFAVEEDGGGPLCSLLASVHSARSLGRLREKATEAFGKLVGAAMELVGLNLDLAPTLDLPHLSTEAGARANNNRSAVPSHQPAEVTGRADAFIRGLARHHVLPCGRHFPGLATVHGEETLAAPVVDRTMVTLWREDLVPYRTLAAKLPMLEISQAVYKAYDYEFSRPASLSPSVVEGLLRLKLGYQGVALSDAFASSRAAGIEISEAAVRALAAGCDLVLVPGEEKCLDAVLTALERAAEFDRLPRERIEQALGRARHAKKGLAIPRREPSERDLARLARDFQDFGRQDAAGEQISG